MQKIMFSTPYFMQYAVLNGYKTMTRRPVGNRMTEWDIEAYLKGYKEVAHGLAQYKIGEVVAIAQPYKDIADNPYFLSELAANEKPVSYMECEPGWSNKLFVAACYMPHQIQITDIKVERLQDITPEDCLKEGIQDDIGPCYWIGADYNLPDWGKYSDRLSEWLPGNGRAEPYFWNDPKKCFANLINVLSGKGTWERNDWVFVYSFKLIK